MQVSRQGLTTTGGPVPTVTGQRFSPIGGEESEGDAIYPQSDLCWEVRQMELHPGGRWIDDDTEERSNEAIEWVEEDLQCQT